MLLLILLYSKINKICKKNCKIDQLRAISKLRIQTKKYEGKYYNNLNLKTGVHSNPEVSTEQINLIDKAIQELKYKSK